jgi:hypothetical protein
MRPRVEQINLIDNEGSVWGRFKLGKENGSIEMQWESVRLVLLSTEY